MNVDQEIAIMNNCDMVIGRIMYMEKEWILIDVVTGTATVKPSSFTARNYLYEILN